MLYGKTTRFFHRWLFSGRTEKVKLLKRKDNQQQGTVTEYALYECRWAGITKQGETIQQDIQVGHRRILHVPVSELERIGVEYINPADRFVDKENRYWQPESDDTIFVKMFGNHLDIPCQRIDPPNNQLKWGG